MYKNEQTTQTNTITQLNAILTNINEITSDTSAPVPKLLELAAKSRELLSTIE